MKFTIYSKYGCPHCEKIKAILFTCNFNHVLYSLDQDFTRQQFIDEFGEGSTFPQVVLDGVKLGGCSDTVKYLKTSGLV